MGAQNSTRSTEDVDCWCPLRRPRGDDDRTDGVTGLNGANSQKSDGAADRRASASSFVSAQSEASGGLPHEREKMINIHARVRPKKHEKIFAKPLDLTKEFVAPSYPKSDDVFQFIDRALGDNFIFASLTDTERRQLIDAMMQEDFPAGTFIIQQGDIGDFFYVVEEGHVSFSVDDNHVGGCSAGGSFGELALMYDCPRAATCIAESDCKMWKVDQLTFRHILASKAATKHQDLHAVLRKVPFLSDLDIQTLTKISDALTTVTFRDGELIIKKGDIGEVFYIIEEGTACVHNIEVGDSQYADQQLGHGDYFGERALLTGEPRVADITSTSSCKCLCLSRDEFEKTLGPLQDIISRTNSKRFLAAVPIFANSEFQHHEMARLADSLSEVKFKKGDIICEEGHAVEGCLYRIRTGKISVANKNGLIKTLQSGDYFGEESLQAEEGSTSDDTITVDEDSTCEILTKSVIESVIGSVKRLGKPLPKSKQSKRLDTSMKLDDLKKVRILGMGAFGKVWLSSHKKTQQVYALKMLNKRQIIGFHQVDGVIREKNIVSSIDHPFVLSLVSTFQDDRHLYMLTELVQGGELFNVIHTGKRRAGLPDADAVFYAACILEALSHLHERYICYRDLKPENVLIDTEGYCKMVDLGFAKVVMHKTFTLCGTPEYLAPEIILSKGHDRGVDYWALGVLIYEMLVGQSPFYANGTSQVALFKRIVSGKFSFPQSKVVSGDAQDLIRGLLTLRQASRLGSLVGGSMDVRSHDWFKAIETEPLLSKDVSAPWIPKVKNPLDASNFDSFKDEERERPSFKPKLTNRHHDLFQDF